MNTRDGSVPDNYSEWLGIPPGPRPPDYYTLLGLAPQTADEAAINQAAKERMTEVRKRALKFPEQATNLLNEIGKAQVCLLDPESRREYDRTLAGPIAVFDLMPDPEPDPVPELGAFPELEAFSEPEPEEEPEEERPGRVYDDWPIPEEPEIAEDGQRSTKVGLLVGLVAAVLLTATVIGLAITWLSDGQEVVQFDTSPSGAVVKMDGQVVGTAPVTLKLTESVTLTVELENYQSEKTTLSRGDGKQRTVVFQLKPLPAVYGLQVDPETARVTVDELGLSIVGDKGLRWLTVPHPDGERTITVKASLPGHTSHVERIVPKPGVKAELRFKLKSLALPWYERGLQHLAQKAYKEAVTEFGHAVEADPTYWPARLARGRVLLRNQDPDGALKDCEEVLWVDGHNVRALAIRAGGRYLKRDFKGARADCKKVFEKDSRCALTWAVRGAVCLHEDAEGSDASAKAASDDCTIAINLGEESGLAYLIRGSARRRLGRYQDGIEDLKQAISMQPLLVAARVERAEAYRLSSNFKDALEDVAEVLKRDPRNAAGYAIRGWIHWQSKKDDPGTAINDSEKALKFDRNNLLAHETLTLVYVSKGKEGHDNVVTYGEGWAALARDNPTRARAQAVLAETWFAMGEHDKAFAAGKEAVRLDLLPGKTRGVPLRSNAARARTHLVIAEVALKKGASKDAIAEARAAVNLDEGAARGHEILTRLLFADEAYTEAQEHAVMWRRLSKSKEAEGYSRATKAFEYLKQGKSPDVRVICGEWIRSDPSDARAYLALAEANLKEEAKKAIDAALQAVRLDEKATPETQLLTRRMRSRLHQLLGVAYEREKDLAEAIKHFREELDRTGASKERQNNLARLYELTEQYAPAAERYALAIENYDDHGARLRLAWMVVTCPDPRAMKSKYGSTDEARKLIEAVRHNSKEQDLVLAECEEIEAACRALNHKWEDAWRSQARAITTLAKKQEAIEKQIKILKIAGDKEQLDAAEYEHREVENRVRLAEARRQLYSKRVNNPRRIRNPFMRE